ncbi:MAG: PAS domain S-box protein, partial [Pyrinomonadaceae bacterium]
MQDEKNHRTDEQVSGEAPRPPAAPTVGGVEQHYKSLFEYHPDAIYSFDLKGNFLSANPACQKISGYRVAELLGKNFEWLIAPEDRERAREGFRRAAAGEPQSLNLAITRKDGHRVELEVVKVPIMVDGETVGVFGISRDIT